MSDFDSRLAEYKAKEDALKNEYGSIRQDALAECRRLVKLFGFSASELGVSAAKSASKPRSHSASPDVEPQFRNPVGTETWSGRGPKKPQWVLDCLAAGYTLDDLRIKNQDKAKAE